MASVDGEPTRRRNRGKPAGWVETPSSERNLVPMSLGTVRLLGRTVPVRSLTGE